MKKEILKGPPELLELFKVLGIEITMDDEFSEQNQKRKFDELIQLVENATERAERFLASLKTIKVGEDCCKKRGLYYKCKKSIIMTEKFCEDCRFFDDGYCSHFQDWIENIDECEDDAPNPEFDEEETLDWMYGGNERDDE